MLPHFFFFCLACNEAVLSEGERDCGIDCQIPSPTSDLRLNCAVTVLISAVRPFVLQLTQRCVVTLL